MQPLLHEPGKYKDQQNHLLSSQSGNENVKVKIGCDLKLVSLSASILIQYFGKFHDRNQFNPI
jgi:hypothetical protein